MYQTFGLGDLLSSDSPDSQTYQNLIVVMEKLNIFEILATFTQQFKVKKTVLDLLISKHSPSFFPP